MIIGKLILKGQIELLTPAMIGSGRSEYSDADVIRDVDGRPYIPSTSLTGVLRHKFNSFNVDKNILDTFWGSKDAKKPEEMRESCIKIDDLLCHNDSYVPCSIRDGVKIDNKRGIAKDKGKFDYEIIERDEKFLLNIEISLDGNNDNIKREILATIVYLLKNDKVRIGAKTNSGFGKIKLINEQYFEFDFSNKQDVLRWLKSDFTKSTTLNAQPLSKTDSEFTIKGFFDIKNSLLIRSYNVDPNKPDTEHIKSKDKPILPGTSLRGAIRARAERIFNTFKKDLHKLDELFGYVDEDKGEARRGRIIVDETLIDGYPEEIQARIKIDRFTGGVIEGALMESAPLFSSRNNRDKEFCISITIKDFKEWEAGLMLLVFKDLWTGDLPVGGEKSIGRGVFKGKRLEVEWGNKKIEIKSDINSLSEENKNLLNRFVNSLENVG